MPYVPPHLRQKSYYEDTSLPKIATTAAEAQAMSKAVLGAPKSGASVLSEMMSKPAPKLAGKVSVKNNVKKPNATTRQALKESNALASLHAAKPALISAITNNAALANTISSTPSLASAAKKSISSGSFAGLIPSPTGNPHFSTQATPVKARAPKVKKAPLPLNPAVTHASTMTTINEPAFDAAMDDILRTIFEENMSSVKRTALANVGDYTRRANGSYKNERLESRYQGFKMQRLEEHAGKASDELEAILRGRFQIAMRGVQRTSRAHPLDFSTRTNGSYVNERLESRFQGYLMASVNDFGLSVLRKIADNRVAALKTIR